MNEPYKALAIEEKANRELNVQSSKGVAGRTGTCNLRKA